MILTVKPEAKMASLMLEARKGAVEYLDGSEDILMPLYGQLLSLHIFVKRGILLGVILEIRD